MSEQPMVLVYVADLRAMVADMRRCLDQVRVGLPGAQQVRAIHELHHTATACAEFSAAFHVTDCAAVAEALAQAFSPSITTGAVSGAPALPAADALNYLAARAARMAEAGQLVAPTLAEQAAANRLVALLVTASDPAAAWRALEPAAPPALTATADEQPAGGVLSAEDLALIQAFQSTPLSPQRTRAAEGPPPRYTAPLDPATGAMGGASEGMPAHLLQVFLSDLEHNLQEVHHALTALEQTPADRAPLATMSLVAHRLKGDAATFEFTLLAELAHAFEDQIRALQSRRVAADAGAIAVLARGLAELDRAWASIAADLPPDPEALARMRTLTGALLEHAPAATLPPPDDWPTQPALPLMSTADMAGMADALEAEASGSQPRVAGGESLLRVDVRRMDELLRRTSALAVNRAEVEQVRAEAVGLRADLERAIGRLDTLSAQLREFSPATMAPPAPPAFTVLASPDTSPQLPDFLRDMPADTTLAHVPPLAGPSLAPAASLRSDTPEVERYSEYDQATLALTEAVADVAACGTTLRAVLQRLQRLTQAQEGLAQDIQQAVMRVRLVPLREQMVLLRQTIRQMAQQQGKAVAFATDGELAEIDRDVSEALTAVLLHLVRNAVTHGIERPEERFAAGKPPEGQIMLHTEYSGNEVAILVRDDGRGINPDLVRASARARGAIDATTARDLSPSEALNLIFEEGVSTMPRATLAAGHGIGMTDVAATLARLHGSIQVQSVVGTGTTFTLRVPIALSNVRAVRIRVAGQDYLVPQAIIQHTLPLPAHPDLPEPSAPSQSLEPSGPQSLAHAPAASQGDARGREGVPWRLALMEEGRPTEVSLYALARLLGRPYIAAPRESALVIEMARQRLALVVDQFTSQEDVVVRSLPPHLQRPGVRGTTITAAGELLLLLDLPALVTRALVHPPPPLPLPESPRPERAPAVGAHPRVLIADDSLSMRHAVESMLVRAGYTVQTARDGMEALEQVLDDPPQLLILDIEMPRLDGFELLSVLRAQPRLASIPVAMLTSRGAQRHRQHAEALGADAYLVKPVTEDDLLATVARLLVVAAQASVLGPNSATSHPS